MKRVWMPLYVADYLKKTSHLRAIESGAYLHLIMAYWVSGKLPTDDRQLATIAKMTTREWKAAKATLAAFFGPGWTHERINEELVRAEEKSTTRSVTGSAGAASKWGELSSTERGKLTRSERLAEARLKATHTKEEWAALLSFCGEHCLRCGHAAPLVKDHITPIYQGGSDGIENLQPLCAKCNGAKGPEAKDLRPNGWQDALQNAWQTPGHSQSPLPSSIKKLSVNLDGEGVKGRKVPPHGAVGKGRIWISTASNDWNTYAEDYRHAHGEYPKPDHDRPGRWFRVEGEQARSA